MCITNALEQFFFFFEIYCFGIFFFFTQLVLWSAPEIDTDALNIISSFLKKKDLLNNGLLAAFVSSHGRQVQEIDRAIHYPTPKKMHGGEEQK